MPIQGNIKRLLQYRLSLEQFRELGFKKVYSHNLAHESGVSPEQVRKDFSLFRIRGNKKGGYNIEALLIHLNELFGFHEVSNVILVGMGNIGRALANYNDQYIGKNVYVVAAFDIDPAKQNRRYGIPVFSMDKLDDLIQGFKVRMAIVCVPAISAQSVCDRLVSCGIKGIMNFAPIVLKSNDNVIISNINLSSEIESVIYYLKANELSQIVIENER